MGQIGEMRHPETLGGKAMGFVYDWISPGTATNSLEKQQGLARYQDFLSEAVADSLAIIPRYGPVIAGITRAAVLIKPENSLGMNLCDFAINAVEGMALRKVATFASPDLRFRHLSDYGALGTQGFSFGVVKSSFRQDSWFDENNKFSLSRGVYTGLSSGIYSGLLSMPAGFLGSKISAAVIDRASSGLGIRSALVLSGLSTGYGTGFFVGGTNAFIEGKSGLELLQAGNHAGLLSSVIGAGMMSATRLRVAALEKPAAEDLANLARHAAKNQSAEQTEVQSAHPIPALSESEIQALTLTKRKDYSPQELLSQSANYSIEQHLTPVLRNPSSTPSFSDRINLSLLSGRSNLASGLYRMLLTRNEAWTMRVYRDQSGSVAPGPLYIKDEYATALDHNLSASAKESNAVINPTIVGTDPHHIAIRQSLYNVPDPTLIRKVNVRPDENIFNPLHQRLTRNPLFESAATAHLKDRELTYNINNGKMQSISSTSDHEWSHLLETKVPEQSATFGIAAALEKHGYYVSPYAKTSVGENWAEHSASFLGPVDSFLQFVHNAPLRAVPLAQAMSRSVQNVESISPGFTDPGLLARIRYTQERTLPDTIANLYARIGSTTDKLEAAQSSMLLGAFGAKADLEVLQNAAARSKFVKAASYNAVLSRHLLDSFQFKGYERLPLNPGEKSLKEFLEFHVNPNNKSYSRDYALAGLANLSRDAQISGFIGQDFNDANGQFKRWFAVLLK